jgi:hypothetical protein
MEPVQIGLESKSDSQPKNSKPKGNKWLIKSTAQCLLITLCISCIYITFLLIDTFIQFLINYFYGADLVKNIFVGYWIHGVEFASVIIIGLLYLFHLLYAIYDQVHFMLKVFQETRKEDTEKEIR